MKLLFVDLDGTLLNDEKTINDADMTAINEMIMAGHKVIINSGRPLYSIMGLAEKFGFLRDGFYLSSFNGGLIYDPVEKKRLIYHPVDVDLVRYFFDEAYKAGIHCHTYTDTNVISEHDTEAFNFYTKRINMPGKIVNDFREEVSAPPKIILISLEGKEALEQFRIEHEDYAKDRLYTTFSDPRLLEYSHPLTNKGEAVRFMCNYLEVPIKDSVSAGDEENDIPMISTAGTGCVMKNGTDETKEVADYITERTNNEGGIAEIIYKFILSAE